MGLQRGVERAQRDAGLDHAAPRLDVDGGDLGEMFAEINDQTFAERLSGQGGPGAARGQRQPFLQGDVHQGAQILPVPWNDHAERKNLIQRRVRCVARAVEDAKERLSPDRAFEPRRRLGVREADVFR